MKAGSIVVFSSLTPHTTRYNTTDETRKAYILQYAPDGAVALQGDPVARLPHRPRAAGPTPGASSPWSSTASPSPPPSQPDRSIAGQARSPWPWAAGVSPTRSHGGEITVAG